MVFVSYFGIIQLLAEHYLQSWLCCRLSFILIWLNLQINKSNTIFLHETVIVFGRSTLFEQRLLKSLSSACPSLRLSVCPSSFLNIGSLVPSDIVHDGPWYLMIADHDIYRLTKPYFWKKRLAVRIGANCLVFASLKLHIMIACNNL